MEIKAIITISYRDLVNTTQWSLFEFPTIIVIIARTMIHVIEDENRFYACSIVSAALSLINYYNILEIITTD